MPLYYENRADKIEQLENPEITDEILAAIEAADLDPNQQEKLEWEFAKELHILTAEPRLRSIAKDFADIIPTFGRAAQGYVRLPEQSDLCADV